MLTELEITAEIERLYRGIDGLKGSLLACDPSQVKGLQFNIYSCFGMIGGLLYAAGIEKNANGVVDVPGTLSEALDLIDALKSQGVK